MHWHAVTAVAPMSAVLVLLGHPVHAVLPMLVLYVDVKHCAHKVASAPPYPATQAHWDCAVAPVVVVLLLTGHAVHAALPVADLK